MFYHSPLLDINSKEHNICLLNEHYERLKEENQRLNELDLSNVNMTSSTEQNNSAVSWYEEQTGGDNANDQLFTTAMSEIIDEEQSMMMNCTNNAQ